MGIKLLEIHVSKTFYHILGNLFHNIIYIRILFSVVGESALHIAIIYGDLEHVKLLIACGANVNERAMGRFFLPEDQKPKRNKITDYEGKVQSMHMLLENKFL